MGTYDVTLPDAQKVVFPPLCVVCERKEPEDFIELSFLGATTTPVLLMATDSALGFDVDPKYYGSNTTNTLRGIPACRSCVSRLKWYHRLLKFGYYTAWIPGIVPLVFLHVSTLISIPFLIACAIAPGILTLVFPPSFGATFFNGKANFEFKSPVVADAFMRLNAGSHAKGEATVDAVVETSASPQRSE